MANEQYLAYGAESVWLTPVAIPNYVDFIKETMSQKRNFNLTRTAGHMEPRAHSVGKYEANGGVDLCCVPDELGWLFRSLFGAAVTSTIVTAGPGYIHVFRPQPTQPFYTVVIARNGMGLKYTSTIVKKVVLKYATGKPTTLNAELLPAKAEISAPVSPTFTTHPDELTFIDWTTDIATVTNALIQALEITMERVDLDEDDFRGSSQFRKGAHAGGFKTTYKADFYFADETELKRFMDGSTGTSPADEVTPFALEIGVDGVIIAGADPYRLTIKTPQVVWSDEKANVDEKKRIVQNMTGEVTHDATQTSGTQLELTNLDTDLT